MVNLLTRRFLRFSLSIMILAVILLLPACTQSNPTPTPQPNPTIDPTKPDPDPTKPDPTKPDPTKPDPTKPDLPPKLNYEEMVVLKCIVCKTDVLSVLDLETFKLISSNKSLPKSEGVPAWITEDGSIPFSKKPTCDSMNKLYIQTLYAGNYYRNYYLTLDEGASYVEIDGKTNRVFAPKSSQHSQAKDFLYNASNLSFANTENILKPMQQAGCLKGSGK